MSTIYGINEGVLIQRLIQGDQTAFDLLFRFYYPGLVVFAQQIVLDLNEAEELVQDFFVKVWIKRTDIKTGETLKSYCFTSVKNRALNFLKKEKINEKVRADIRKMIENDLLYQPDLFVESELQVRIRKAFDKLPPRTAEIFNLNRFEGFSNAEIAEQLNISKRTVETQVSNALKILREELKEYMYALTLITGRNALNSGLFNKDINKNHFY